MGMAGLTTPHVLWYTYGIPWITVYQWYTTLKGGAMPLKMAHPCRDRVVRKWVPLYVRVTLAKPSPQGGFPGTRAHVRRSFIRVGWLCEGCGVTFDKLPIDMIPENVQEAWSLRKEEWLQVPLPSMIDMATFREIESEMPSAADRGEALEGPPGGEPGFPVDLGGGGIATPERDAGLDT